MMLIGDRTKEMAQDLLMGFQGDLMSDGCQVFRHISKRLRCWAQLERKAKRLKESWDKTAAEFGAYALASFETLRMAVYRMREQTDLELATEQEICDERRLKFMADCLCHLDSEHPGVGAFAFEVLNDH